MLPPSRLRSVAVVLVLGVVVTLLIVGQVASPARGGGFPAQAGGQNEEAPPAPVRTIYLASPMTVQAAKTWLRLQEHVTVSFPHETPLVDFLGFLKDETRGKDKQEPAIRFFVDPAGLQEADNAMTSPVVIDLEEVPLATVLELTLHQLGLRYYVQKDGIVMINSDNSDTPGTMGDPGALILDNLSKLRTEVSTLKREVARLRYGR
jgi:hypothetical protein